MGEMTLKEALDEYKNVYMAYRNFAERTREEYRNDLEALIEFLMRSGINRVKEMGLPAIERYVAQLEQKGYASLTRKRKVVTIRSFLRFLYQDRYISTNISKQLIPPFAGAGSPRYLTKLEIGRLLAACSDNKRDYAIIQIFLKTGITLSELARLTVDDIELRPEDNTQTKESGFLYIKAVKRKKARILPINDEICISLRKYFKERAPAFDSAVFLNRLGKRLGPRGIEKIVQKYTRLAGIRNANVQSLRHTFGVHEIGSGVDKKAVQKLMGHRDSRTTFLYSTLVKFESIN